LEQALFSQRSGPTLKNTVGLTLTALPRLSKKRIKVVLFHNEVLKVNVVVDIVLLESNVTLLLIPV
jgi:hypothetical protein